MEAIRICRLTENDLPLYFEKQWEYLCRDLFSEDDTEEDRAYFASHEYRNEVKRRLKNGTLLLLCYQTEKNAIGFAQIALEKGCARVMEYWISPEHRRKGLGKICWQETETRLQRLGVRKITLEAATKDAEKFWLAMGFAKLKQDRYEKCIKIAEITETYML